MSLVPGLPLFLAFLIACAMPSLHRPAAAESAPDWSPQSSERLVRLPPQYLKKSLDHDFASSGLAQALQALDEKLDLKARGIAELQEAAAVADGEARIELRHRLLAEKQAYVQQMRNRTDLRRRRLQTERRVLEQTLERVGREAAPLAPVRAALLARQEQARARFQSTSLQTDMTALAAPTVPESRYSRTYAANLAAIEKLVQAIDRHPMSVSPAGDAAVRSREDWIRDLLAEAEAGLALLNQEEQIIGHMARLVALDAAALAAQLEHSDANPEAAAAGQDATSAVPLFLTR